MRQLSLLLPQHLFHICGEGPNRLHHWLVNLEFHSALQMHIQNIQAQKNNKDLMIEWDESQLQLVRHV